MTQSEPWFVAAFRSDYLQVYTHRDLASSRREAQYVQAQGIEGPTLDLCCGFGRHTLAMRELGLDVVGLDLSADLLAHARTLPGAELVLSRLVRGDALHLPFADRRFALVVNLFSSFGYFGDAGDRQVLCEVRRVLRPAGGLILDLMNPERVRAGLVPRSHTERDGWVLEEQRSLADGGRRVVKDVRLTRAGDPTRAWREDVRLYTADEIAELLADARLSLLRIDGDFDGRPFTPDAPRQIVHVTRPAR